jgi:hypothetical protein
MSSTKKLVRRTYTKTAEGLYVCPECPTYTAVNQSTMCMHMNKYHDPSREIKCTWCDKIFVEKKTLEDHLSTRAGKGGHPSLAKATAGFACPFADCTFSSPSKGNCRTHCMRVHAAKETNAILERTKDSIECKTCTRTFDTMTGFYYHSMGCISLPVGDERHALLEQIA